MTERPPRPPPTHAVAPSVGSEATTARGEQAGRRNPRPTTGTFLRRDILVAATAWGFSATEQGEQAALGRLGDRLRRGGEDVNNASLVLCIDSRDDRDLRGVVMNVKVGLATRLCHET